MVVISEGHCGCPRGIMSEERLGCLRGIYGCQSLGEQVYPHCIPWVWVRLGTSLTTVLNVSTS